MKKALLVVFLCLAAVPAFAKKTTIIYTDNRFNWVKIVEMNKKDSEKIKPTLPAVFTEEQLRAILKEIKLSRSVIMKKEVETQDIFDERGINFLAPKLVDALAKATDKDVVEFSYLTKDPIFILRDDRLTIGRVWVKDTDLYFAFDKLFAQLLGDYDKRGDFSKSIARAKGLRLSLDVRDGQSYGETTGELVIDTTRDFTKPAVETTDTEIATTKTPEKTAEAKSTAKSTPLPEPVRTVRDRLKELDQLKEDGLVTEKEYNQKKRDILKGL